MEYAVMGILPTYTMEKNLANKQKCLLSMFYVPDSTKNVFLSCYG